MGYNDYWHSKYDLGEGASEGLVELLTHLPSDFASQHSLDIGCGQGRNFHAIKSLSKYLVGIEPNKTAAESSVLSNGADEVLDTTFQDYASQASGLSDLIVGWRVMHLGTLRECQANIEILTQLLNEGGYMALALSSRDCPYYGITKSESGGIEIEDGTVKRSNKNDDVRHFFTYDELEGVHQSLQIVAHNQFSERKGGSPHKFKKYHAVLFQKCQN